MYPHITALMCAPCGSLDNEICWFESVGLGLTNGGQTPMGSYNARLRVIGQTGFPVPVVLDLTDEQLTVTTDSGRLADWNIAEIDISTRADGFHVEAEGEEILLNVTDSARFAVELGVVDFLSKAR
jgi:hypothetical protein